MNVVAQGLDLVECRRIEKLLANHHERFLSRILTPGERQIAERRKTKVQFVAGRFAAKEAILKALGTGWRGEIAWTDMEILHDPAGAPQVTLSGACLKEAQKRGIVKLLVSITHTDDYAAATCLALCRESDTPSV